MFGASRVEKAYKLARQIYGDWGVDTEAALGRLEQFSLSLHCWQGDDVAGFESPDAALSGGGIQVTGSYPGRARSISELRSDLKQAFALIPGRHRLNLHAMYGEFGAEAPERNAIATDHFQGWIDWARSEGLGLDFNATCFSHPKAASGFTLSHPDTSTRQYWIEHVQLCREIAADMGEKLQSPCIHNLWIPDGCKDLPADRWAPRERLTESLDAIFATEYPRESLKDALESKLFGIGSEAYVVGSHEFYLGYTLSRNLMPCFDMGHFHPTESVADKISAVLQFSDELLLHISRPLRWDSDHVVILDDAVVAVTVEVVRAAGRVYLALDYFDASINRVGAWTIGARATLMGLLMGLLQPMSHLQSHEAAGRFFERLAVYESAKSMPFGAVWDYYCHKRGVPTGQAWLSAIQDYERRVLRDRE